MQIRRLIGVGNNIASKKYQFRHFWIQTIYLCTKRNFRISNLVNFVQKEFKRIRIPKKMIEWTLNFRLSNVLLFEITHLSKHNVNMNAVWTVYPWKRNECWNAFAVVSIGECVYMNDMMWIWIICDVCWSKIHFKQ